MPDDSTADSEVIVEDIMNSAKYRGMDLCEDTVNDLVVQEMRLNQKKSIVLKNVRRKLHNIVAQYLGDPDYAQASKSLNQAYTAGNEQSVKDACLEIMRSHTSTRERIPHLQAIYETIFRYSLIPVSIMDLACGLNPLSFPWMGLPNSTTYHAYDINRPRIELINHFFELQGLEQSAIAADVLVKIPDITVDIAFIFKEIHRFEQRRQGSSLELMDNLKTSHIVVSLPAQSMKTKHDFTTSYQKYFYKIISPKEWRVDEFVIGNEMFFHINKEA